MKKLGIFILALMFVLPVSAKQDKDTDAGGVRSDHASDMGLEKGKAWAGDKEKKEKEKKEKKSKNEKEDKKGKKDKKDKKDKKEK